MVLERVFQGMFDLNFKSLEIVPDCNLLEKGFNVTPSPPLASLLHSLIIIKISSSMQGISYLSNPEIQAGGVMQ